MASHLVSIKMKSADLYLLVVRRYPVRFAPVNTDMHSIYPGCVMVAQRGFKCTGNIIAQLDLSGIHTIGFD